MKYTELTVEHKRTIVRQRLLELEAEHYKTSMNLRDALTMAPEMVAQLNGKLGALDAQHERALQELHDLEPSEEEPADE